MNELIKPPTHKDKCWVCGKFSPDEGWSFDTEFDTWFHKRCLDREGVETILEYENNGREDAG